MPIHFSALLFFNHLGRGAGGGGYFNACQSYQSISWLTLYEFLYGAPNMYLFAMALGAESTL